LSAQSLEQLIILCAQHFYFNSSNCHEPLDEENVAKDEIQCLSDAIKEIERVLRQNEKMIKADGGAHLFASSGVG